MGSWPESTVERNGGYFSMKIWWCFNGVQHENGGKSLLFYVAYFVLFADVASTSC